MLHLICAKLRTQEAGDCRKVSCRSNEDCSKQTILPTYCTGGLCQRKTCYTSQECPKGYACDSAGQCKQVKMKEYVKANVFHCLRILDLACFLATAQIVMKLNVSIRLAYAARIMMSVSSVPGMARRRGLRQPISLKTKIHLVTTISNHHLKGIFGF